MPARTVRRRAAKSSHPAARQCPATRRVPRDAALQGEVGVGVGVVRGALSCVRVAGWGVLGSPHGVLRACCVVLQRCHLAIRAGPVLACARRSSPGDVPRRGTSDYYVLVSAQE